MTQTFSLRNQYIDDIPWDRTPTFIFTKDSDAYIDAFRKAVDLIPYTNLKISFYDDIWDFNSYMSDVNHSSFRVSFEGISDETLKNYYKFFFLYLVMDRNRKISTAIVRYNGIRYMLEHIMQSTMHRNVHLITTDDIVDEISSRDIAASTAHGMYVAAYQFFYFLKHNYRLDVQVDIEKMNELSIKYKKLERISLDENKIPNIPEKFYIKIINACIDVMRNTTADYNDRAVACEIILLSQTGLRLGDLLALKCDQIHETTLPKIGMSTYYIHYTAQKPSKPHSPVLEFDIFCSPLCKEAFTTLKKIRTQNQYSIECDYLFLLSHGSEEVKYKYPVTRAKFNKEYKKFLYDFLPTECTQEWEGVNPSIYTYSQKGASGYIRTTIYAPDTRQYRVHLCTDLYNKGVNLSYIQRYMGHLSDHMLGYYVRPKDEYQENVVESEKVIQSIVGDGLTPIDSSGSTILGKEMKKRITEFIADNKFDVYKDIDEVMKTIGDRLIIRAKTGGMCIRTSFLTCKNDVRTNEVLCAFNVCPNLFHFYYMIDVTYQSFLDLQKTYTRNKDIGHQLDAEKELNKIHDLIKRRLAPEMEELEKDLAVKGKDAVIEKYPSLKDIVERREEIKKEYETWMKM